MQKVLPVDTMKVIMFELLSAEELSNMILVKDTLQKGKKLNMQFYQEILTRHHLTKEAYYASYKYFDARPDKMKVLLDSVAAYAERMKQKENDRLSKKRKP